MICRWYEGKPFTAPLASPLPLFRVNEVPPFMYTAVDFGDTLYIKNKEDSSSTKVWICLFTCCVTCAIHLGLVADLTTTSIQCLRRFSARRGLPRRILPDNARPSRQLRVQSKLSFLTRKSRTTSYMPEMNGNSILKRLHGGVGSSNG